MLVIDYLWEWIVMSISNQNLLDRELSHLTSEQRRMVAQESSDIGKWRVIQSFNKSKEKVELANPITRLEYILKVEKDYLCVLIGNQLKDGSTINKDQLRNEKEKWDRLWSVRSLCHDLNMFQFHGQHQNIMSYITLFALAIGLVERTSYDIVHENEEEKNMYKLWSSHGNRRAQELNRYLEAGTIPPAFYHNRESLDFLFCDLIIQQSLGLTTIKKILNSPIYHAWVMVMHEYNCADRTIEKQLFSDPNQEKEDCLSMIEVMLYQFCSENNLCSKESIKDTKSYHIYQKMQNKFEDKVGKKGPFRIIKINGKCEKVPR